MSDFDGIDTAPTGSDKKPFLRAGRYLLQITAIKKIKSRKAEKFFVIEYRVKEASGVGANEVGSECSHMIKMSLDNALANIKGFVVALLNDDTLKVDAQVTEDLVSDDQPARNSLIRADADTIRTKAGTDFTLVRYSPAESSKVVAA